MNSSEFAEIRAPFKKRLPPLRGYLKDLLARRSFIHTYAITEIRRQNLDSFFGQLWLVLNPLALAAIFYILLFIIRKDSSTPNFLHLLSNVLLFYFVSNCLTDGVKSITNASSLLLNSRFPRLVLPLASTLIGVYKFAPTFIIILLAKVVMGSPFSLNNLFAIPIFFILAILTFSLAVFASVSNIYFRDTQNILPFVLRGLLYLSPILFLAESLPSSLWLIKYLNPLYLIFSNWSLALLNGTAPIGKEIGISTLITLSLFLTSLWVFLRQEKEMAVRV